MQTVESALRESQRRIRERRDRIYGTPEDELQYRLGLLRSVMFQRKRREEEAFQPLNGDELAVLEHAIRGYRKSGRFVVGRECFMEHAYRTIRHNWICGDQEVGPEEFHAASGAITHALIPRVGDHIGMDIWGPDTVAMIIWRAGFAFADAAREYFSKFYHFGARRDERTLKTKVYFEEVPDCLLHHPENQKVLVMDPMLATGNTTNTVLHRLADHGVPQENTFIVSVISAPEGVDNVLQKYPGVRIFAGRHDEGLNKEGYIIPGLGDYGDMSFEGLDRVQVAAWRDKEILSSRAATALLDRMAGRC